MEIRKTKNYEVFKKHPSNREIDTSNLKRLVASIKANDMLKFRPILLDAQFRVIDGGHRLKAAMDLGLEIYYQVNEESSVKDMVALNLAQEKWKMGDYVHFYASQGDENFIKLQDFCNRNKVEVMEAIPILFGTYAGKRRDLRRGKLPYPSDEIVKEKEELLFKCRDVIGFLASISLKRETFLLSKKMKHALFFFLSTPGVNSEVLKKKIHVGIEKLRPCVTVEGYYAMFAEIYNWRNRDPVPERVDLLDSVSSERF